MHILLILLTHLLHSLRVCARQPLPPPPDYDADLDNGAEGWYPTRSYITEPDIQSPATNFLQWSPECDDGLLTFLTPRGHSLPSPRPGPMILDARGELVWHKYFHNAFGGEAYNLLVQRYQGEEFLTFWLGDDRVRGHGAGFYYMLNSSYDIVHKIGGANGLSADLHEFLITPEDTVLMTIYEIVPGDVSMFRDFNPETNKHDNEANYIWDGIAQEIDIATGELIFEWRASEHVDVTETYRPIYGMGNKNDPFDWYHVNSIQKDKLGNYLVSARYTHSLMYIDGKTKETIWQLGGQKNDFMDLSEGMGINFAWQHDARFQPLDAFPESYTPPMHREGYTTKLVTLFDNAAEDQHYDYGLEYSRGLVLELTYPTPGVERFNDDEAITTTDLAARTFRKRNWDQYKIDTTNGTDAAYTVRVIKSYENPQATRSSSQGNIQLLPQGPGKDPKVFVGYGLDAVYTEFAPNGSVLCDAHYGPRMSWDSGHIQSYRDYKFAWTGRPKWTPKVVLSDDDLIVYVSWLGATDIEEWTLQSSRSGSTNDADWRDLLRVPKISFETAIIVPRPEDGGSPDRYLRVVATTTERAELPNGRSPVLDRGIMNAYFPSVSKQLPRKVASLTPAKAFFIVLCCAASLVVCYELYRRWLSWRGGRPGVGGAVRWRKGVFPGGILGSEA